MRSDAGRIADRVLAVGVVSEPYALPDGTVISSYFDEYRVAADPDLLRDVGRALAKLLPPDVEVVAGLELGGVPFALAVSAAAQLPLVLIRKAIKPYGTRRQVEGDPVTGRRVVMIDDVVRSGRQILTAANALVAAGGLPTAAVTILTRPGQAAAVLAEHGISLDSMLPPVPQHPAMPTVMRR
ncbi:orotate phosphoribosyltransferase [Micromonospora endolithica]|nr:phosphoribosyltransferase family protein [Micromonospora endolithica]TWJ24742.1 orotate phosphoribosyltransferase [Micromonospora endolithica]